LRIALPKYSLTVCFDRNRRSPISGFAEHGLAGAQWHAHVRRGPHEGGDRRVRLDQPVGELDPTGDDRPLRGGALVERDAGVAPRLLEVDAVAGHALEHAGVRVEVEDHRLARPGERRDALRHALQHLGHVGPGEDPRRHLLHGVQRGHAAPLVRRRASQLQQRDRLPARGTEGIS
jgi:hypothetical protein